MPECKTHPLKSVALVGKQSKEIKKIKQVKTWQEQTTNSSWCRAQNWWRPSQSLETRWNVVDTEIALKWMINSEKMYSDQCCGMVSSKSYRSKEKQKLKEDLVTNDMT